MDKLKKTVINIVAWLIMAALVMIAIGLLLLAVGLVWKGVLAVWGTIMLSLWT